MRRFLSVMAGSVLLLSCSRVAFVDSGDYPPIVPDYIGVTVPEGMAAISFEMADGRSCKARVERVGDTLFYHVRAWDRKTGKGVQYAPFPVYLSHDPIDPYIAYRLIEPGYEGWKEMGLYVRELASYREHALVTNRSTGGGCVNCHNFPGGDPSRMVFHARGAGGGAAAPGSGRLIAAPTDRLNCSPHKRNCRYRNITEILPLHGQEKSAAARAFFRV